MTLAVYLILMAGVTYLIRMIPFTLVRGKIKSAYVRSFLGYVPYAVLSAMTFPAVFYSTGDIRTAVCGSAAALVLAFLNCPLTVVSLSAATVVFIVSLFLK